jgi:hypothetical protein
MVMKMTVFWDTVPCSLVKGDWRFRGLPWWWNQYAPPKHQSTSTLHGATPQKDVIFILATVRTWNVTKMEMSTSTYYNMNIWYILTLNKWPWINSSFADAQWWLSWNSDKLFWFSWCIQIPVVNYWPILSTTPGNRTELVLTTLSCYSSVKEVRCYQHETCVHICT